jgi:hypothetical protein
LGNFLKLFPGLYCILKEFSAISTVLLPVAIFF